MPYKNAEDRKAQKQRWAAQHREHELQRKAAYNAKHRAENREYQNERNFRFRAWETARTSAKVLELVGILSIGTAGELTDPLFIFEHGGHRRRETLSEPLPTW